MRVSTAIRLVVICLLGVGVARAADFDKAFPVKGNLVEMNLDLGNGIVLTRVEINNIPSLDDIQKGGNDRSHPKPTLFLTNKTNSDIRIFANVTLEDGQGNVLMKCAKNTNVDGDETSYSQNLCWMEYILSKDWPRVKVLHISGNASPKQ